MTSELKRWLSGVAVGAVIGAAVASAATFMGAQASTEPLRLPAGSVQAQAAGSVPQNILDFFNRFGAPNPSRAGVGTTCTLASVELTAGTVGNGTPAEGQILPISQNTALFALLGTAYGGNGMTTFALPDLRGLAPKNMTYTICTQGVFPTMPDPAR